MSEYEPIDLERDAAHLKNELMDVGRTAGLYVSRAALEFGNDDPRTELFDNVAQRLTVLFLEFQSDLTDIDRKVEKTCTCLYEVTPAMCPQHGVLSST